MNSPPHGEETRWIPADNPAFSYPGAASIQRETDGLILPLRVAASNLPLLDPELVSTAAIPSGVRIAFETDSTDLAIKSRTTPSTIGPCTSPWELVINGEQVETRPAPSSGVTRFSKLQTGPKTVEIWFPHTGVTHLQQVGISSDAQYSPTTPQGPNWVGYGSSLTQSRFGASPRQTWPALVATELGMNLTNRGYAGQAHLDPLIAAEIRDAPADLITLELGINIALSGSMNPRTFLAATTGFVSTIREKHPSVPLMLIAPTWVAAIDQQPATPKLIPALARRLMHQRESLRPHLGMTQDDLCSVLTQVAERLNKSYPGQTVFLDGTDLLGKNDQRLLQDGVHYTPNGERHVAKRLAPHLRRLLDG